MLRTVRIRGRKTDPLKNEEEEETQERRVIVVQPTLAILMIVFQSFADGIDGAAFRKGLKHKPPSGHHRLPS